MLGFVNNFLAKRGAQSEYHEMLTKFLSDGNLDEGEKRKLEELAQKHGLSKSDVQYAHKQTTSVFFKNISSDERISEDEKKGLEALMSYFDLKQTDFDFNQGAFNKYYSLALIDKGVLPTPQHEGLNVILKDGEVLHWLCSATLKKRKTVTTGANFHGLTGSFKLMKGVRYRIGALQFAPDTSEVMVDEDTGTFWLTNQRIGFLGHKKNFTLPYGKVLSYELYKDGISIVKEGKENPHIVGMKDVELPAAVLSTLVNR